jgi:GT2 family glycosyltransferase
MRAVQPRVSVVLATYNRPELLVRLLGDLARQTLPASDFEVVVVDDGSVPPVAPRIEPRAFPFALKVIAQPNAGPSAARHRGVLEASGEILVLVDDDMNLPTGFLAAHVAHHASGRPTAVFGRYVSDPRIGEKPLFERYLGLKWDQLSRGVADGSIRVNGTLLATGNASMRREDYLRVGGLDRSLPRAEDMALGLELEEIGVQLVFSETAYSVHLSDHTEARTFRRRVYVHGTLEPGIARRHPAMPHADPWRFAFSLPLTGRVLCLPSFVAPALGQRLADVVYRAAEVADRAGLEHAAMRATGLVYGLEYFRGMREQAGSLRAMLASCAEFLDKAARAPTPTPGVPARLARMVSALVTARRSRSS